MVGSLHCGTLGDGEAEADGDESVAGEGLGDREVVTVAAGPEHETTSSTPPKPTQRPMEE